MGLFQYLSVRPINNDNRRLLAKNYSGELLKGNITPTRAFNNAKTNVTFDIFTDISKKPNKNNKNKVNIKTNNHNKNGNPTRGNRNQNNNGHFCRGLNKCRDTRCNLPHNYQKLNYKII